MNEFMERGESSHDGDREADWDALFGRQDKPTPEPVTMEEAHVPELAPEAQPVDVTVPDEPPTQSNRQRRSQWAELLAEVRAHPGEWRRIKDPMKKTTAAQIASDIRNVHNRDLSKTRLRGFLDDDRFEAVWGEREDEKGSGRFYIWLRFIA